MNIIFVFLASLALAGDAYERGVETSVPKEREEAFNEALNLYMQLPQPKRGGGALYYNIGNTFYQLGEYPYALLYYAKASKQMPESQALDHNISLAREKAGLPPKEPSSIFKNIFFFHTFFSFSSRMQFFLSFSFLSFALFSLHIWFPLRFFKLSSICMGLFAALFLLSLAYTRYIEPMRAILVKSTSLYRDDSTAYAPVRSEPAKAGQEAIILNITKEGMWLQIETEDGELGYVQKRALQVI
ncbi:MAG: hypothetical protein WD595_02735 [Waddliaceae bacterium]